MRNDPELAKKVLKRGYFTRLPHRYENFSQVQMWRSVLDMALADLLRGKEHYNTVWKEPGDEEWLSWSSFVSSAEPWLSPTNEDFNIVCNYSLLQPDQVYRRFMTILYPVSNP